MTGQAEGRRYGHGGSVTDHVAVRRGAYHDSVALMAVSRTAAELPGVETALVAMATDLNLGMVADMGFAPDAVGDAGPDDLVVALRARNETALAVALAAVEEALAARPPADATGFGAQEPPRTVATAAGRGDHRLALVSVPGPSAFVEAMDALRAGLHVMVFSDNVPVEQEIALKEEAGRRGLLVMGPDCGTAIVGGLGLGFANVVRPGPVGIVGASGTGTQQVCCLLDSAGVGVRHALGVGGRDLSAEVGGASTLTALAALDADPGVEVIVVVSKPPAPAVAERVRQAAAACATPVVLALLGIHGSDLTTTTHAVLARLDRDGWSPRVWEAGPRSPVDGSLHGLFAGGTLCDEAKMVAAELPTAGHWMLDLGDDSLTRGRPHPMIDQRLRVGRIGEEGRGDGVLLLDVVLGHAAHPDPAAELAPAIAAARARAASGDHDLHVVVSLCGTARDPQGLERQADQLVAAGASVHVSNAEAARAAVRLVGGVPR